jgi:invasion protein IalB
MPRLGIIMKTIARVSLIAAGLAAAITAAGAQSAPTEPLKVASLVEPGKAIPPGDLLRTTRIFPNWNLNCEVLLSEARHLCAVELRSVDAQGRQVFSWSIALSTTGSPLIILRVPADISPGYGLHMVIGAFTTILKPRREDCTPSACQMVAPFETALRTLMVSQEKIGFSLERDGVVLQIEAPLAGLSEALEMARRDPIGLLAARGGLPAPPSQKIADANYKTAKPAAKAAPVKFDDQIFKLRLKP